MKALAELVPQVFFDILARYVPGLVLLGSWIIMFGHDEWRWLLNAVVGGQLNSGNAIAAATLVLLFVPFVVGYVIAPAAKIVQRGNEHGWWLPPLPSRSVYEGADRRWRPKYWWVMSDKAAGDGYDWLRKNAPEAGAFAAKIRAEFTMHNALAVAFLAISVMALFAGEILWAAASGSIVLLMVRRGAETEKTFQSTTRKLCRAASQDSSQNPARPAPELDPAPRLIWLIPGNRNDQFLWEDGKDWLDELKLWLTLETRRKRQDELRRKWLRELVDMGVDERTLPGTSQRESTAETIAAVKKWAGTAGKICSRSGRRTFRAEGRKWARKLQHEAAPEFVFRRPGIFWRIKP
ncbi:hypothetical protein [Paractinoplanes brasiliensis]|uniref:Uncharacterized protein n=1 Tax=Paractinoplanes brasiliensis TaxID=52695 RepID=A0A4R6K0G8_9ACTN|nr:hypothetical protein [Actinoplanes brasiliensis]TDO41076.1 hypothetical protein C8E87_4803 [Actinoplanes brasiliensis]GID26146.1 hypothetical protein Abr02nite_11290 [Actinoplanes brasiliensis]